MRLITLLLITLLLAACSAASASTGKLSVDGAWARPAPQSVNSAFFMTITNDSAETVTLTAVDTIACGVTELHKSTMQDGVMSMRPMSDGIEIPAGETVAFEPGGLHVMCLDKPAELLVGEAHALTLHFDGVERLEISAEIRE